MYFDQFFEEPDRRLIQNNNETDYEAGEEWFDQTSKDYKPATIKPVEFNASVTKNDVVSTNI